MNNNLVFLEGFLVEKPTLKMSKDGSKKYCNGAISVKGRKKVLETGYYDRTIFNFTAFGKNAERLSNFCDKGTRINLFGELGMNKYVTQENVVNEQGVIEKKEKKHYAIQIACTDFTILSKTQKESSDEEDVNENTEKEGNQNNQSNTNSISSQTEEEYYEENKLSEEEASDMFFDGVFDLDVPF
ncbi:single-stranded DNA-binding protein [Faecalitalea cylindroides]|uniref:Single-stranded DNA-binding protein n=1 Tax=Faecalitalea cylindroides TaxID=39483 RepID=A0AAW6FSL6_9FIRM|nr:single-stranded DNA-binding protein [Faecalitalea cylindroides]MDC0827976.1 single-stranded DNA-binding protein [Faecalitalea cylindroides]